MSALQHAIPVEWSTLLDYQDEAVVSRTILKKKTGTVTVFAFDKGQELSEHTAPFDAMVQVLDGRAEITISGEDTMVEDGQIIILPANQPHALRAIGRFKMMLIMIRDG